MAAIHQLAVNESVTVPNYKNLQEIPLIFLTAVPDCSKYAHKPR